MTSLIPQPDWEPLQKLVTDSLTSPRSKTTYREALAHFVSWWGANARDMGFCRASVNQYRAFLHDQGASPATINLRLAAVRKLASEGMDNGLMPHNEALAITRIHGVRSGGRKAGNWLTKAQVEQLLRLPNETTVKGARDRAILMLLVGCGLRRDELVRLTIDQVQQRDGRWALVDVVGKGNYTRTVPMPAWAKRAVDVWREARDGAVEANHWLSKAIVAQFGCGCGVSGCEGPGEVQWVFFPITRHGHISPRQISSHALYQLVQEYGRQIGIPKLAPHDLRRTYARLADKGKARLSQIQMSLGHRSIETTKIYLGGGQDFDSAPCDVLGLDLE